MRLSDAIATGRVLVDQLKVADLRGCALGMALLATGNSTGLCNYDKIKEMWPWLSTSDYHCTDCKSSCIWDRAFGITIYRAFDQHVMMDKTMTLDQLIDWVRSIEPVPQEELAREEENKDLVPEFIR